MFWWVAGVGPGDFVLDWTVVMTVVDAQAWTILVGTTIAAVTAAIASLISSWRTRRVEKKVDVVHELTNSRLSRIDGQLAAALAEISVLRAVAAKAEQTRVALADAVAPPPSSF